MWILKNSKVLLQNLQLLLFCFVNSIKTFDFLIPYTTIPRNKLQSKLRDIITSISFTRMEIIAYSMLVLAMQMLTLFRATLMHYTNTLDADAVKMVE